ncbi:MAG: hypothetical protein JSU63_00175 [Phycisphaerales bacterium]|nr:MAG: hypothetical protein JSU63_00175 [Phycisphaerales bacterium]
MDAETTQPQDRSAELRFGLSALDYPVDPVTRWSAADRYADGRITGELLFTRVIREPATPAPPALIGTLAIRRRHR